MLSVTLEDIHQLKRIWTKASERSQSFRKIDAMGVDSEAYSLIAWEYQQAIERRLNAMIQSYVTENLDAYMQELMAASDA